ncbi:MAG: MFS transporter [Bacteroidaceae bacterium]|nr:MFS transporter [Bacteroidaceae bacterium]MBR4528007.1 MFS transporter [Bacteroidaceae bacterium]MBR6046903.1 MFS transporter [Bacteroidaceae bacterium]
MSKTSLTNRKYVVPFILITTLFFLWGFARAMLDVLNKHFQDTLNISITQSSLIQVSSYLAYFMMAIPAGIFINRYGYRKGVVFGLLLFAVGSFLFIPGAQVEAFSLYLGALFIIACGLAFLETAANPYSTLLGPKETSTSRLNLSQSFNGLGSALGPFIMGGYLFSQADANLSLPYAVMGMVVAVVAVIFSRVNLPEIQSDDASEAETPKHPLKTLMTNRMFLFGLSALLAYEVSEISINSYFVNFVTGMGWMKADVASYVLGLSLFVFMGGRFLGSWIMRSIKAERMLYWCATGSIVSILLVILTSISETNETSWTRYLPVAFLMANYLCEAIMFPTIFALAVQGLGNLTKSAASILMMTPVGGCGFLLMALIADYTTLIIPFALPLLGFVIVWAYARKKCA